jgi:signal transduction histidine kinase
MRRLYLQIDLAIVASLALFAVIAGAIWWNTFDTGRFSRNFEIAADLAGSLLPPADAVPERQREALNDLARRLHADMALKRADGTPIAEAGKPLPAVNPARQGSYWLVAGGNPAWALRLADGRWLVVRLAGEGDRRGRPGFVVVYLVIAAGVVALCAYPVVRGLTRRLERLKAGVERLGAGDLAARVPVQGKDEIAALAASVNKSAERIEELVRSHKLLLAHCSHELRTPLARLRVGLELAGGDPARREALQRDVAELDALIGEILLMSRLDATRAPDRREPVDLLALAAEEAAAYDLDAEGDAVTVTGDPALLRRLVRNLLENARRHAGGAIRIAVRHEGGAAVLEVEDRGPGIAEAERARVFEPFRRASNSAGAGLGLALVRQIAEAHGGSAAALPAKPNGANLRVTLPLAA